MKSLHALALASLLALPAASAEKAAAPNPAWEKLESLAGDWTGTMGGKPGTVTYRVVSNGTALMETMDAENHTQMITMYHPDGDTLLMTHYCTMGNQPRMRAKGLKDGALDFEYVDASNLSGPDAPRMSRLVIHFVDADHIVNAWTYKEGTKEGTERVSLTRKR